MNLRHGSTIEQLTQELEDKAQSREMLKFGSMPDVKQLRDREIAQVEESGTYKLIIRIGNTLYKTDLTEV
jgi:hypothetical protein